MYSYNILAVLALAAPIFAHMELSTPLPFRSKLKTNPIFPQIDYTNTAPLKPDGSDFPCKGYHVDISDPVAGVSTATYTPGSKASFVWEGGATHGGGSCQAALSYDKGVTWNVIASFIGSCPITTGKSFDFTVPSDTPGGSAIMGVTWFNVIGNREMYMNCASVTVGKANKAKRAESVAFSARPSLFVANLGNGCLTVEGKEVVFPNPGPDVINQVTVGDNTGSIKGTCAAVKGVGGSNGPPNAAPVVSAHPIAAPSSFATSASATPTSTADPEPTNLTIIPVPAATSTTPSAPVNTATPSGSPSNSLTPSKDGQCGGTQTCVGNTFGAGQCCSAFGYCGSGVDHCGTGCMAAFGLCGVNGTSIKMRGVKSRIVRLL